MSDNTDPLPKGLQILESDSADFDKLLWHFQIGTGDYVAAGRYAVLPIESFTKMNVRLQEAQRLLREVMIVGPISPKHKEMVERYFDPEPFV